MSAPGVDEAVDVAGRLADHQVRVDGQLRQPADCGDDVRAEGDVGHEMPVHDVKMEPIDARPLELADDAIEVAEIGGQ